MPRAGPPRRQSRAGARDGLRRRLWTVLTLHLAAAGSVSGQTVEWVGTRALGMAGAFVAVADDASAIYWNPAGLATGPFLSAALDVATLGEPGGREISAGGAGLEGRGTFAGASTLPVGVAYYRLRSSGAVSGGDGTGQLATLETGHLAVSLVQSLSPALAVGTALKWVHGDAATGVSAAPPGAWLDDAQALDGQGGDTFDLDVGVMATAGRARLGLVGRNLRQPSFGARGGGTLELGRQIRAGFAWRAGQRVLLAADADLTSTDTPLGEKRHLAAGVEWQVLPAALVLRGGARASTAGDAAPAGSAGLSAAVSDGVWLDAQITRGAAGGSASWGVAGRLAF